MENLKALYCKALKSIELPRTIESIRAKAFMNCQSLESIYIPDTVELLDDDIDDISFSDVDSTESTNYITSKELAKCIADGLDKEKNIKANSFETNEDAAKYVLENIPAGTTNEPGLNTLPFA